MAITAAKKLADFNGFIKPELAGPIFDEAAKGSAAMSLIRKVPLGASGQAFPIVTSKPTANWTAEGTKKHTTEAGLGLVKMKPEKLTAIAVASQEVIRANPGGYSETLKALLSEAFARAFDLAVFHNKGGDGNGTSPFETTLAATTKTLTLGNVAGTNTYDDIVKAMALNLQGTPKKKVTGFAFDTGFEIDLLNTKDTTGKPLFAEAAYTGAVPALRSGSVLGRATYMHENVGDGKTVGFAGDWTKAAWGTVGGITMDISTEATVTINGELVSLYENNLVAVRAEAEYGFTVSDKDAFVKIARK
jgi:HK97 family phage major capsid protein|nr:MAG TPA: Major capsid protein [Caudoviricetes sp.]